MKKPVIAGLIFLMGILIAHALYTGIIGKHLLKPAGDIPALGPVSITPEEPVAALPLQQEASDEDHGEAPPETGKSVSIPPDAALPGGDEYYVQAGSWKNAGSARRALKDIKTYYPEAYIESQNNFSKIRIPNISGKKQGTDIVRDLEEKLDLAPLLVLKTSNRDVAGAAKKQAESSLAKNGTALVGEKVNVTREYAGPVRKEEKHAALPEEKKEKATAVAAEATPAPEEVYGGVEDKAETVMSGEAPGPASRETPPVIAEVPAVVPVAPLTGEIEAAPDLEQTAETAEGPSLTAPPASEGISAQGKEELPVIEEAGPVEQAPPAAESLEQTGEKVPAAPVEEIPASEEVYGVAEEKAAASSSVGAVPEQGEEVKEAESTEAISDITGGHAAGGSAKLPGIALIISPPAVPPVPGPIAPPSGGLAGIALPDEKEEIPEKAEEPLTGEGLAAGTMENVMPQRTAQEAPGVWKRPANGDVTITYNNRVAVLPFENLSGDIDAVRHIIPLIVDHMENKGFKVVDQDRMNESLCKGRVRSTGYLTREVAAKIQREFNASIVLAGSVISFSEEGDVKFGVLARLIDISDGQILWADFASATGKDFTTVLELGTLNSVFSLVPIVMDRLFSSLDIERLSRETGPAYRIAVMPFRNNSHYRNAGMIAMHMFVIELLRGRNIRPIEYGAIRNSIVHLKIKNRGELSYRDIHGLSETLDADEIIIGVIDEYSEGVGDSAPPKVAITARLIDGRNNKIVWYNSGQLTGEDDVIVLDWGRIRSVHAVAYRVVSNLVKTMDTVR